MTLRSTLALLLTFPLAAQASPSWLPERMEVSTEVRETLAPLPASSYPRTALDERFAALRTSGDAFCRAWRLQQDIPHASDFLVPAARDRVLAIQNGGRTSMVVGCHNFFEMNDIHPERAFALVRALEGAGGSLPRFDCYGVGLVQPWMMHQALGCRRLGMVDLDWRILEAHHRLAGMLAVSRFTSPDAVQQATGGLELRWLALRALDETGKVTGAPPVLCRSGQDAACRQLFVELQSATPPERLELLLTGLEDLSLGSGEEGVRRVVFLSNAVEYMVPTRTLGMVKRLAEELPEGPGASALLIHHAAGSSAFGIYRVTRGTRGGFGLRHVCKDVYPSSLKAATEPTYVTVLDKAVPESAPPPPTCRQLLTRFKLSGAPAHKPTRP
jgi:hypothetical protein